MGMEKGCCGMSQILFIQCTYYQEANRMYSTQMRALTRGRVEWGSENRLKVREAEVTPGLWRRKSKLTAVLCF